MMQDAVQPLCHTVVLVDDEPSTLAAYRAILNRHAPNLEVLASIDDGSQAAETIIGTAPDIVLLDLHMPRVDGLEVLRRLAPYQLHTKVMISTAFDDRSLVVTALRLGAAGYLLKTASAQQLVRALYAAAADDLPLSPEIVRMLIGGSQSSRRYGTVLSQREIDVLHALSDGATNKQIAERLFLAESTVKQYVSTIANKLGVRTRTQILIAAAKSGLIAW
ncbi:response regulator transcription factor [uncultured Tessaracoccus sp.]|uniref:response regulator n=1 Tax=uncultured Tessaracoccus sp. TaxID=905023 RepID=UPI002611983B|nr:response regulator transcription factor [uncultured Tessaracoccus sp.]